MAATADKCLYAFLYSCSSHSSSCMRSHSWREAMLLTCCHRGCWCLARKHKAGIRWGKKIRIGRVSCDTCGKRCTSSSPHSFVLALQNAAVAALCFGECRRMIFLMLSWVLLGITENFWLFSC